MTTVAFEQAYPFDTQAVYEDQWKQMARWWAPKGVLSGCTVTRTAVDQVQVAPGEVWINGFYGTNAAAKVVPTSQIANLTVVARLDNVNNQIVFATIPAAQAPAADEIPLASWLFAAGGSVVDGRHFTGAGTGLVVIQDTLLTADGPISFPNIPQTFTHLQIIASAKCSRADQLYDLFGLRFNGDSGNNYFNGLLNSNSTGTVAGSGGAANVATFGTALASGGGGTPTRFSAHRVELPDYANTVRQKQASGQHTAIDAGVTYQGVSSCLWLSTAAINQIDVIAQSGAWKAGSRVTLLGIK